LFSAREFRASTLAVRRRIRRLGRLAGHVGLDRLVAGKSVVRMVHGLFPSPHTCAGGHGEPGSGGACGAPGAFRQSKRPVLLTVVSVDAALFLDSQRMGLHASADQDSSDTGWQAPSPQSASNSGSSVYAVAASGRVIMEGALQQDGFDGPAFRSPSAATPKNSP